LESVCFVLTFFDGVVANHQRFLLGVVRKVVVKEVEAA